MAALMAGTTIADASREFDIPAGTIKAWSRDKSQLVIMDDPQKKDDLGDLLYVALTEALTTLAAQARFFRDVEWLRNQDASEVAILYGVVSDKAFRILTAIEQAAEQHEADGIELP